MVLIKTETQAKLDKLREAYDKKIASVNVGYDQELSDHYDMIRVAQRTKDDADWMIRFHQTQADIIRAEQEKRRREVRLEYETAVASFLSRGEVPEGWENG